MSESIPIEDTGGPRPASKRILDRLRSNAGRQRLNSLNRLEGACDSLEKTGTKIFFEGVGRECDRMFKKGPNGQSIRNDPGFKEYVTARLDEQAAANEQQSGRGRAHARTPLLDFIDRVPDRIMRAKLRDMHAELADLRRRDQDTAALLAALTPGLDMDALLRRWRTGGGRPISLQSLDPEAAAPVAAVSGADPQALAALERLLEILTSGTALKKVGLTYDGKRITQSRAPYGELIPAGLLSSVAVLLGRGADINGGEPAHVDAVSTGP